MIRDEFAPRIYFDAPVALQLEDDAVIVEARAHNLSHSGLFVGVEDPFPVEARVHLSFDLPDGTLFSAGAEVVRIVNEASAVEPVGMALHFDEVDEISSERLADFLAARMQPAAGERVRLLLGDVNVPIAARAQGSFGDILSVDADLPFLTLGSEVTLSGAGEISGEGEIRWVSVHVSPETGVPCLNIGIQRYDVGSAVLDDEEHDPVCTGDFAHHAESLDHEIRQERKSGKHPKQKRPATSKARPAAKPTPEDQPTA